MIDLGQHFLKDRNVVKKIIQELALKKEDVIFEIGAGRGILTEEILRSNIKKLYAVEIDKSLVKFLKNKFSSFKNIELIEGDFLKIEVEKIIKETNKIKIVGNIPYSITSDILKKIFDLKNFWSLCILMLQKEVALKLISKPSSSYFSKLTLIANFYTKISLVFNVSKKSFYPQPKVDSAVVKFLPNDEYDSFKFKKELFSLIDCVFKHKRKTILNSISLEFGVEKFFLKKILENFEEKLNKRPQDLDLDIFLKISEKLSSLTNLSKKN